MNKKELLQHLQNVLVNIPELNTFIDERFKQKYPDVNMDTFETDEVAESKYYDFDASYRQALIMEAMRYFTVID